MSIFYKKGYKYQLCERYAVQTDVRPLGSVGNEYVRLYRSGLLAVSRGYAWDGATMCPDFDWIIRGSLIHDALYQLMREKMLPQFAREQADKELRKACIEDGAKRWQAWLVWKMVRLFGAGNAAPRSRREVLRAPRRTRDGLHGN